MISSGEKNTITQLEKSIIKEFWIHDTDRINSKNISRCCFELIGLCDKDRLLNTGCILLYLVSNIGENLPDNIDLFLLAIYPYIYPKIETWEELAIDAGNAPYKKQMQTREREFFSKISQSQAKTILDALNIISRKHPDVLNNEDFDLALIMYWEARAKGQTSFAL